MGSCENKIFPRPQEIGNHPEVIRRRSVIGVNAALACDIHGNVNSTHVNGTHMMTGIGGSVDFARNAYLEIFVTKALANDGALFLIAPMVPHMDHNEYHADGIATEIDLADLSGLTPRGRAPTIIQNRVHPSYRELAADYLKRTTQREGQTLHLLEKAFSWHIRARQTGRMLPTSRVGLSSEAPMRT
ncbi:acetyl-CoA hydrolase/transferase C-terminal domain-containing protein [Microvirga makkahensis]|uniref:acetyl-CoA hydrolase/transferase C-terminal domain-containing protein n=1 Tax=Microvirga makkahensis TaxID=1128670 RepID=UPI00197B48FC|nr:acetyl-CoA hydrolase/transferase C-terminal domain-containing protein [Microvirga makkahensis]